jgi:hypothetical protein
VCAAALEARRCEEAASRVTLEESKKSSERGVRISALARVALEGFLEASPNERGRWVLVRSADGETHVTSGGAAWRQAPKTIARRGYGAGRAWWRRYGADLRDVLASAGQLATPRSRADRSSVATNVGFGSPTNAG